MTRRVLTALAGAVLLTACGAAGPADEPLPATDACAAATFPTLQEGGHLLQAEPPVAWSSTPGTSGWHASGAPRMGIFALDEELTEPQVVLALELGNIVATYDPGRLPEDEIAELESIATSEHAGRLTVTPFTERDQDAPLVLNGWGVRQTCDELEPDTVARFIDTYLPRSPGHPG